MFYLTWDQLEAFASDYSELPYAKRSAKDKQAYAEGQKHYKEELNPEEKQEFHRLWEAAYGASKHADANPTNENHMAASKAHWAAYRKAPTKQRANMHMQFANRHRDIATKLLNEMKRKGMIRKPGSPLKGTLAA